MGQATVIAWADSTFNIAFGCCKVSPGCKHCYAEGIVKKAGANLWGPAATTDRRQMGSSYWKQPLAWNEAARKAGKPSRVFSSSMCDVFEDHPMIASERERLWQIVRSTPWLHWMLLTKRPERIRECLPSDWGEGYPNVWLGVSIENMEYAWRADELRKIPAVVHFISYEPALGPLDRIDLTNIQWLIVGGESGQNYREMPDEWARAMKIACRKANVAFFFKQSAARYTETGIKLDGRIIREYPPAPIPPYAGGNPILLGTAEPTPTPKSIRSGPPGQTRLF